MFRKIGLFFLMIIVCHPDENRDLVRLNEIPYLVRNDSTFHIDQDKIDSFFLQLQKSEDIFKIFYDHIECG
jgi:hypothetical protein